MLGTSWALELLLTAEGREDSIPPRATALPRGKGLWAAPLNGDMSSQGLLMSRRGACSPAGASPPNSRLGTTPAWGGAECSAAQAQDLRPAGRHACR